MTKLISGHQGAIKGQSRGNQGAIKINHCTHLPGEPGEGCLVERATVALAVAGLGFEGQSLRALRHQLCLECLNLTCRLLEVV